MDKAHATACLHARPPLLHDHSPNPYRRNKTQPQIALLGRSSKTTKVGEICTRGSNIVVAKTSDCIDTCMRKMLAKVRSRMEVVDRPGLGLVGCLGLVWFVSLVSCFGGLGWLVWLSRPELRNSSRSFTHTTHPDYPPKTGHPAPARGGRREEGGASAKFLCVQ